MTSVLLCRLWRNNWSCNHFESSKVFIFCSLELKNSFMAFFIFRNFSKALERDNHRTFVNYSKLKYWLSKSFKNDEHL